MNNAVTALRIFLAFGKLDTKGKGQLISKCPYEKSVSSKIPTKIFLQFCPEIFCSFLRASWRFFGLPGDLISNVINKGTSINDVSDFRVGKGVQNDPKNRTF